MDEEKKLAKLHDVRVNPARRQQDFTAVQSRLNRKTFQWQIPAVVLAIACLILFLAGTLPNSQQHLTANESSPAPLQAVYYTDWEGNPNSLWQAGVNNIKDNAALREIEEALLQLERLETSTEDRGIYKTYKLQFADERVLRLYEYTYGDLHLYRNIDTGQVSALDGTSLSAIVQTYEAHAGKGPLLAGLAVIIVLIFAANRVSKKLRDPQDAKRKLPMHSTYWQSAVEILSILLLILLLFVPQLHLFMFTGFLLLSALVQILLEAKHGNNKWRMLQFLLTKLLCGAYLYVVLWDII